MPANLSPERPKALASLRPRLPSAFLLAIYP